MKKENQGILGAWHLAFAQMQRLGQALMLPVSVLPAAGLMVALGRILTDFTDQKESFSYLLGKVIFSSGLVVFEQLPLIFGVGVALGFAGLQGIAGLAAVTGYFAFTTVLKTFSESMKLASPINTGVFGGIIIGITVASLYNRFHTVKLHPILGFFSGKRLVPILSVIASVGVALIFVGVWPPIQQGIHDFGVSVMANPLGPSWYASIKRLLIPVGLHHVFYPSFLYEFGTFVTATGQEVHGEASRYFAGDPTAGKFMASEFPMMIFGLPMAALAMYLRAKPENRKTIAGVMLSAGLTSILTGITEPIEFAFTFVAPPLYLAHALITFFSGYLTSLFDIHLGYTFSASILDMFVGYFNQKNMSLVFLIVGPIIGLIYFLVFYFAIGFFDYKTPGREDEAVEMDESTGSKSTGLEEKAKKVLELLGGPSNLLQLDACITRLRLRMKDDSIVSNVAPFKALGATGMIKPGGGNVQIVFGVESDFLKTEIQNLIAKGESGSRSGTTDSGKGIFSPLNGTYVPVQEIPDETFKQEMMGQTFAILPTEGKVYAPFDGEVASLFHTHHALGLVSKEGVECLIHVGIDTVKLKGEGFSPRVKNGDSVIRGQLLLEFDIDVIQKHGKSLVTPIVITNSADLKNLEIALIPNGSITQGQKLWNLK